MKLNFPNLSRPKKASKLLAKQLGKPLATIQCAVSRACGYSNWHELERNHDDNAPSILDEKLIPEEFIKRQCIITLRISEEIQMENGDVQYALAHARLTGNRSIKLQEQIAIRLSCWKATCLPTASKRQPGAIGKINARGWRNEPVILLKFGRPTYSISDWGRCTCGDFEYVSPRKPMDLFIPRRLFLPYGVWTEADGARVYFSRDYKPMWRLRQNSSVERMMPWEWIDFVHQEFLWDHRLTPTPIAGTPHPFETLLAEKGLNCLPVLADAVPLLVKYGRPENTNIDMGADLLEKNRVN